MALWRYMVFKIVLLFYRLLNSLTSLAFGFSLFSGHSRERLDMSKVYEKSAHVLKVKWKMRKFELEGPMLKKHFLLRHVRYTHPEAVLAPNVTLLNLDPHFAVFAVVQGPNKDVLKHTTGPFMYINQFKLCSELIRMPIESFLRLAEEIGDPVGKLVILSNTGRCGSTLLTQLFEELPHTVAISEPEVLMAFTHGKDFDDEEPKRKQEILQACIRLLCKNHRGQDIKCICIKPKAHAIAVAKLIYDLYPTSSHLYLYRHPAEYVRSLITVYKSLLHPLARSLMLYLAFDFSMYDFIMRQFLDTEQRYSSIYEAKMVDSLQHINLRRYVKRFAALFSGNLLAMLQLQKEENIPMCMISYHELKEKENTDKEMRRILQYCNLTHLIHENEEITLPEKDSQKNSGLSQSALRSYRAQLTDNEIEKIDEILRKCGFPSCEYFPLDSVALVKALDL